MMYPHKKKKIKKKQAIFCYPKGVGEVTRAEIMVLHTRAYAHTNTNNIKFNKKLILLFVIAIQYKTNIS